MNLEDPRIFALFLDLYGGLPRAAPGSDEATRQALAMVSTAHIESVLDLGCGPGAQTLSLARALPTSNLAALDILPSMAAETRRRCAAEGFEKRVLTLIADMGAPPVFPASQDLIWCEGAIYFLGVEQALKSWRDLLTDGGCIAFTEPVWLRSNPHREIRLWWEKEYPGITNPDGVEAAVRSAGYEVLGTFPLRPEAWWEAYYQPLESYIPEFGRIHSNDQDAAEIVAAAREEISMFRRFGEYYSYQFFVTRPTGS